MPWKECQIVQERLRFIARLLDGEKMAGLCREFGISRKTGYKIYNRYKDCGIDGLTDRSRRPYRHANQLPMQIEKLIVNLKKSIRRHSNDPGTIATPEVVHMGCTQDPDRKQKRQETATGRDGERSRCPLSRHQYSACRPGSKRLGEAHHLATLNAMSQDHASRH